MAMTASRLIELAERCERASGPDRELDLWIEAAINPQYEGLDEEHARFLTKYGGHQAYTASLDAAMSLYIEVPERIPSNPRLAAAEALRQRAAQ